MRGRVSVSISVSVDDLLWLPVAARLCYTTALSLAPPGNAPPHLRERETSEKHTMKIKRRSSVNPNGDLNKRIGGGGEGGSSPQVYDE